MYNTIVLEREEPIAILRFDRPNVLNALNRQVFLEMISIFEEIQKEVVPKVVILTGSGDRAFIAGTDITEMENLSSFDAREFASLARRAIDSIDILDRPVIAAINGFALGVVARWLWHAIFVLLRRRQNWDSLRLTWALFQNQVELNDYPV